MMDGVVLKLLNFKKIFFKYDKYFKVHSQELR